jgi:hypothetical protein
LKCPENLFSGNYARVRHVQFDKSHQKYGTVRACASIFLLVLSNGLQRDRSVDGSTLRVGSIDAGERRTTFDPSPDLL